MPKYTIALLRENIARDEAILIGEYSKTSINSQIEYICKCGAHSNKVFRLIVENGGARCKTCTEIMRNKKIRQTNLEKFGVEYPLSSEQIKDKAKATNLKKLGVEYPTQSKKVLDKRVKTYKENYGVENPLQSNIIKDKLQTTCLDKYGVRCVLKSEKVKDKIRVTNIEKYGVENPFESDEIKEKIKKTNMLKYGVEHVSKSDTIQEKIKLTNIERRGVEYPGQSSEVKEKAKITNMSKYGVENPFESDEIKEKIKKTNLEKYGVEHPSQNAVVMERTQKNAKKYKEFVMPSGTILKVQGYEPFALKELLMRYSEEQIKTNRKDVPRIEYVVDSKKRYYFPDIFIPHENKIIEVKSTWTYKCKADNIELKGNACIDSGYKYELWCFDAKGKRIEL